MCRWAWVERNLLFAMKTKHWGGVLPDPAGIHLVVVHVIGTEDG
jgi:hypothetical protein